MARLQEQLPQICESFCVLAGGFGLVQSELMRENKQKHKAQMTGIFYFFFFASFCLFREQPERMENGQN